jgi:hypothetical protein
MTTDAKPVKPVALDLEVEEIEAFGATGCNSSTTSSRCTCRPITGDLFTAKPAG